MRNLIQENIGLILKSIDYKATTSSEQKKIDSNDEIKLLAITSDSAELEITRYVNADLQNSYRLKVVAGVTLYAKPGVDLSKLLTVEKLEENKEQLTGVPMGYVSSLISQITGSFGGYPVVTAPGLRKDLKIQDKTK